MKISYSVTVCDEFVEIQKLIPFLLKNKGIQDEIVILFDSNNGSKLVEEYLRAKSVNGEFMWHPYKFDGHFANMKNKLSSYCSGDYIVNIDADEIVDEYFIRLIPQVLEFNKVDVVLVPRINTVEGIGLHSLNKWGWSINDKNHINFPDFQWRIYKNSPEIYWENKVHERLTGYKTISHLPQTEEWCLIHHKTIEKQEKQNNFYATL
jgi:hypothetical protein